MPKDNEEGFKEYKHLILNNLDQFKLCRDQHSSNLEKVRTEIDTMRREILKEAKDIVVAINKMDRRLIMVEVKGGMWGVIGGTIVSVAVGLAPQIFQIMTK